MEVVVPKGCLNCIFSVRTPTPPNRPSTPPATRTTKSIKSAAAASTKSTSSATRVLSEMAPPVHTTAALPNPSYGASLGVDCLCQAGPLRRREHFCYIATWGALLDSVPCVIRLSQVNSNALSLIGGSTENSHLCQSQ